MAPDKILLVDDELDAIQGCEYSLESEGYSDIISCQDSRDVMKLMEESQVDLVFLDLSMPHISGQELLPEIVQHYPDVPVVIVTGVNDIEIAVECMKSGAFDYLVKPVDSTKLAASAARALEIRELRKEYASFKGRVLSNKLDNPEVFSHIVTRNSRMNTIFQYCETVALTSRPVLITGDTGTGKELFAKAIHDASGLSGEFVAVNVAGLDDNMFSDTLFGHLKGAFTGADKSRAGLVERAAGGTLFLDEIGDLELSSQVKLLRLLQENEYLPIGADAAKPAEARVVVATNRDLQQLQQDGKFRPDLYYRLQTHTINLPPLRERRDDIPLLVDSFIEKAADSLDRPEPTVPRELYTLLSAYSFPGNVRELEAMVFEAVSQHQEKVLSCASFKEHIARHTDTAQDQMKDDEDGSSVFSLFETLPALSDVPGMLIDEAMRRADGNQTVAAGLLGITRSGLSKAIKRRAEK